MSRTQSMIPHARRARYPPFTARPFAAGLRRRPLRRLTSPRPTPFRQARNEEVSYADMARKNVAFGTWNEQRDHLATPAYTMAHVMVVCRSSLGRRRSVRQRGKCQQYGKALVRWRECPAVRFLPRRPQGRRAAPPGDGGR